VNIWISILAPCVGLAFTTQAAYAGGLATQVTTGYAPTCALTSTGGAWCWGFNASGEVGDGTAGNIRPTAVPVVGLANGIVAVSSGFQHSCALNAVGAVACWGVNTYGQLGDGSTVSRSAPVAVAGLGSGVTAIAAGGFHTCAARVDGTVICWGYNAFGELGDGTTQNRSTPVDVLGLTHPVVALSGGVEHTCAIDNAGAALCWGHNSLGQLGDGTNTDRATPVAVSGLSADVAAISAGQLHSCAVTAAGAALCWGSNLSGELGDDTTTSRNVPAGVQSLANGVSRIAAGAFHSCALTAVGAVRCWGSNTHGQLGDATQIDRHRPVPVTNLSNATAIAAGTEFGCAVLADGGVRCWGRGQYGNLGDGGTLDRTTPIAALGFGNPLFADGFE